MSRIRNVAVLLVFVFIGLTASASQILVPMDERQSNHLKAYGIAFWVLEQQEIVNWLLNFRGGSFTFPYTQKFINELIIRGVSYEVISDSEMNNILAEIGSPSSNTGW